MGLGSILGGIGGLLIPGGNAISSAIGSGLGSLIIDKKKPKDAIKNALIAGVGAKFFGGAIQGSGIGSGITRGLGSMGLGLGNFSGMGGSFGGSVAGSAGSAGSAVANSAGQVIQETAMQDLVQKGAQQGAEKGILSKVMGGNPMMLYSGLAALGAVGELSGSDQSMGQDLYVDRYTGRRFSTPEERDQYEDMFREKQGFEYPDGTPPRVQGFAQGGYIEGPGTGRSDSIPAQIYQDGQPVEDAALSDGEFVMTSRAVQGAGNGDREKGAANMYAMMREFERGGV